MSVFIRSNITEQERERETEELGAIKTKVTMPGKTVPYKTQTLFLTNAVTHSQVPSVTFSKYGQKVNKHDI